MPTLRQKVDHFCKDSGAKVDVSDKLRGQVKDLKEELKKVKDEHKKHMKEMKKTAKVKAAPKAKTEKAPRKPKTPKAAPAPVQAEPMLPAETRSRALEAQMGPNGYARAATVPVPAPSLAPAAPMVKGGRTRRHRVKRPVLRW
jgi:hypothetical protein